MIVINKYIFTGAHWLSIDARYLKYLLYTQAASIIYYSYALIIAAKKSLHLAYNGIPGMSSQHYETLLVTVVSALKCWLTAIDAHVDLSISGISTDQPTLTYRSLPSDINDNTMNKNGNDNH